jgi:tetratricopeptide (TPR) repeat protein
MPKIQHVAALAAGLVAVPFLNGASRCIKSIVPNRARTSQMMPKFLMVAGLALFYFVNVDDSTAQVVQDAPITDCDTYAASPLDSARKAVGVSFGNLDPDLAIPACESAVKTYPASPRLAYQLGRSYDRRKDVSSALGLYRKAAEQGYAVAQVNLGVIYFNSEGMKDPVEAIKWTRKAADQGLAVAQYHLGVAYDHGDGVPQDYTEALKWYRKAADQGYSAAQTNIGQMYFEGHGVTRSVVESLTWIRKAADGGDENAKKLFAKVQSNSLTGADLPKITSTYSENEIRFKRDYVGKSFSDVLVFRNATENMFWSGLYTIEFGIGRFTSDLDCSESNKEKIAAMADWKKGDHILVEGIVKDVTLGSVKLDPCSMTK